MPLCLKFLLIQKILSYTLLVAVRKFCVIFFVLILLTLSGASKDIKNGQEPTINLGDTRETVLGKWGEPAQKDRVFNVGDRREVWVYTCEYLTPCPRDCDWYYELPCYYLFFVNGELTAWEDVR